MYEIDLKNFNGEKKLGFLFLIVGIIFFLIIAGITFSGKIKKMSLDSEVKATSINDNCHYDSDGEYLCSPEYTYYVEGQRYVCNINYSSSNKVNKSKDIVYYDSKNPTKCAIEYEVDQPIYMYLICLFPLLFVFFGFKKMNDVNKKIKKVQYLAQYGTLVQGLQYTMEDTGMVVNNNHIYAPVVNYTLPSGSVVKLKGQGRFDHQNSDADGLIDLLIDLNDPSNYYMDFEIKRKM